MTAGGLVGSEDLAALGPNHLHSGDLCVQKGPDSREELEGRKAWQLLEELRVQQLPPLLQ